MWTIMVIVYLRTVLKPGSLDMVWYTTMDLSMRMALGQKVGKTEAKEVEQMNEDHAPGVCYACKKDTQVRWKNLYTIGSEGTNLCMSCEMVLVTLLRKMANDATRERVRLIKQRKGGD
jgi:hypothetical protein